MHSVCREVKWCSCCALPMIMMIRISLMRHIFWVNNELMHSINFLPSSYDHILLITYAWMNLLTKKKKKQREKMVVGLHCETCSEVVFAEKWYENENNDDVEEDFWRSGMRTSLIWCYYRFTIIIIIIKYHHHDEELHALHLSVSFCNKNIPTENTLTLLFSLFFFCTPSDNLSVKTNRWRYYAIT